MQRIKLSKNLGLSFFVLTLATTGLSLSTAFLSGCASKEVSESNSAEAAFNSALEFENDERYEEALAKFNEVKNKHPYSRYAVESELHIADIQYKRESYIEAQTAYQLFKDFHPKNPKIDYVTYRLAMSYFMQLPPTADRDLTPATKAIQFFDEVINSYPTSEYVKDAKAKKAEAIHMLAQKEDYIGNFYFIRDMYESAQRRYEGLLDKYPNQGFDEEALYRAGVSAYEAGNNDKGKEHLEDLLKRFPNGDWVSKAKSALEKYGSRG
jgi:outer membrane protein assembly factor BamD